MLYTQWLRIRNCLRGFGWVYLALFLLAIAIRIQANSVMDVSHWKDQAFAPGAHYTTQKLPDGTERTTIVSADKKTHVVVDDRGWFGKHVHATTTGTNIGGDQRDSNRELGMFSVQTSQTATGSTFDMDSQGQPIDLGILIAFALFPALIMATILGAPLSRENGDHLEVVFTRPISRTRLAAGMIGVDLLGILATMVLTVVLVLACIALFIAPGLTITATGFWFALTAILAAFGWYAMYLAASSWMKRGRGVVLGLAWLAGLIIVPALAMVPLGETPLARAIHWVFHSVAYLDPLAYINADFHGIQQMNGATPVSGIFGFSLEQTALALLALTIVYIVAGLYEWQKVEA